MNNGIPVFWRNKKHLQVLNSVEVMNRQASRGARLHSFNVFLGEPAWIDLGEHFAPLDCDFLDHKVWRYAVYRNIDKEKAIPFPNIGGNHSGAVNPNVWSVQTQTREDEIGRSYGSYGGNDREKRLNGFDEIEHCCTPSVREVRIGLQELYLTEGFANGNRKEE